jgi:hypothetical protein
MAQPLSSAERDGSASLKRGLPELNESFYAAYAVFYEGTRQERNVLEYILSPVLVQTSGVKSRLKCVKFIAVGVLAALAATAHHCEADTLSCTKRLSLSAFSPNIH